MKETIKMNYKILSLLFAMILSVSFGCDVVPDLTTTGNNKDSGDNKENNITYNDFQGYMLVDYSPKRKIRYRAHMLRQKEGNRELVELNIPRISKSSCRSSKIVSLNGCNILYGCKEYPLSESKAFIMNNTTKKKEILFEVGRFSTSFIDVSPDSRHYLISLFDEENLGEAVGVAEYHLDGGKIEEICDFEKEFCLSAGYSPDGKYLLISKKPKGDETENFNIYLKDLENSNETLFISSEYNDIYPKWSKDGKFIAYGECPSIERGKCELNECYLRLIDAQNPKENLLVDDRKLCYLASKLHFDFSPDSKNIAYTITLDPEKCGYNIASREIALSENKITLGEIINLTDHTGYHSLELYSSGYILRSWRDECTSSDNNNEMNTEAADNRNYNNDNVPYFKKISSGENHVCGLDEDGFLWCWGINDSGQLGIGSSGYKAHASKPVKVNESRWLKVSAGEGHTCGIKEDETLWCWGRNEMGQLGNSNKGWSQNETKPVKIDDNIWKDVTAGEAHTCGIKDDGTLWCWGSNYLKQLGDSTKKDRSKPAKSTDGKWKKVYSGDTYTCGTKENNELWCWGLMEQISVNKVYNDPESYTNLSFKYLSAGDHHICGIDDNNSIWCWGEVEHHWDIDGDERFSTTPEINTYPPEQPYEGEWEQVSCGGVFTCGIKEDGTLWCWGANYDSGQLGLGYIEEELSPVQVGMNNDWMYVSTGNSHACAIKQDNTVYCWGSNMTGQLGDGSFENRYEPVLISN